MGAIQGIFAHNTTHCNTRTQPFGSIQRNGRRAYPITDASCRRKRYGLDVCQLLDNSPARSSRLVEKFRDATKPVFEELYEEVAKGNETQRSIDTNSKGYRDGLNKELKELRESEMWQAGVTVRKLRENN